ncbi:MAG: hypothetical protein QUV05_04020 [Phycisphaerae bacterium]|nr:hypothetical protein [Phycisphaerae bacterium]
MAEEISTQREFPCVKCGADLLFTPGTTALTCPYCGQENQIPVEPERVEESDYSATLAELAAGEELHETLAVRCSSCAAESSLPPNVTADKCPFCGAPIVALAASRKLIRPGYLLPFHVTREQAMESFRCWIASRWFAPSSLHRNAEAGTLSGIYMPAWTYNCDTDSDYTGQRGDDYWDTKTYHAIVNGRTVTRTRQVRKTRWTSVSGQVQNAFADLLVRASDSLPEEHFHALEPWDLRNLVGYRDEFLAGFVCESYQIDLPAGFEHARQDMEEPIRNTVRRDIGGDHQQIDTVSTRYSNITFKHILLPLWLSAYRYHDITYRFMVNARTGEVRGERPYSFWKITLLISAILSVIAVIVLLANMNR